VEVNSCQQNSIIIAMNMESSGKHDTITKWRGKMKKSNNGGTCELVGN
jgi:hypothetical protein